MKVGHGGEYEVGYGLFSSTHNGVFSVILLGMRKRGRNAVGGQMHLGGFQLLFVFTIYLVIIFLYSLFTDHLYEDSKIAADGYS